MAQKLVWAHRVFFPAACLYAALAVPLSVYAMTSGSGWLMAWVGAGHGFEMLFGFALAVVAGYTLGPTEPRFLWMLFLVWLVARIIQFIAPFSFMALALSMLFGLALAWRTVPRFVAAKKWRNKLLMPLLGGLCVLPALFLITQHAGMPVASHLVLQEAVLFLSLLMAFMGGRIIAPAVAGQLQKQGYTLEARVQPRVEGALIVCLVVAAPALTIPGGTVVAGTTIVLAGVLIIFRLMRWQLLRWHSRLDLVALYVGYTWLGFGLCVLGIVIAGGRPSTVALHIVTVGALGSLTSGVMSRTYYQRLRRTPPPGLLSVWLVSCIAIAVLARVGADLGGVSYRVELLWLAASAWSLCFGALFWLFATDVFALLKAQPESNGDSASDRLG
jgi:uncharacterized protein involved in response to NO